MSELICGLCDVAIFGVRFAQRKRGNCGFREPCSDEFRSDSRVSEEISPPRPVPGQETGRRETLSPEFFFSQHLSKSLNQAKKQKSDLIEFTGCLTESCLFLPALKSASLGHAPRSGATVINVQAPRRQQEPRETSRRLTRTNPLDPGRSPRLPTLPSGSHQAPHSLSRALQLQG